VKLAHEAGGGAADEEEIPEVAPRAAAPSSGAAAGAAPGGRGAGNRQERRARPPAGGMTRLFVGVGRSAGIRPHDLVGAIAGESRLSGREIGAIEIAHRYSLVEVPQANATEVIAALRGTTIKGRRAVVRRERDPAR
jgi:ATP-dependent RNA helicase DeaD